MVTKITKLDMSVVEATRQRIINIFDNGLTVYLSMSSGKDSICLAHSVYKLIQEGKVDPKQLVVMFVDEEAMFDEIDRITLDWRKKFQAVGAKFIWWCIEVKHFNCFRLLTEEESFMCWDSTQPENWVRPMKSFAVTDHPLLRRRKDNYQAFLKRITKNGITMVGVRMAESVQRQTSFSNKNQNMMWPIYDWKETDIWRYIKENKLDFPSTYMDMYAIGTPRPRMRISQFFGHDSAGVLVRLAEFNPGLMEKVERREPNAYMAALYFDTEMFKRAKRVDAKENRKIDWKRKVFDFLKDSKNYNSPIRASDIRSARRTLWMHGEHMRNEEYMKLYRIMTGGDPKKRSSRALNIVIGGRHRNENESQASREPVSSTDHS